MSRVTLSFLLAAAVTSVVSQVTNPTQTFPPTPLANKHFSYPTGIPEQVDQDDLIRGTQSGYNICNATTEGPNSLCQTSFINYIDDWCVWAPATPNETIADTEGQEVAWCTKPGRGTRIIPAGAIKGVQFLVAPSYLEVLAFLDQTMLNLQASDYGGELDPHGADLRGNPMGALVYSNNLPISGTHDNNTYTQVMEWHNFIGANFSCFKACDPADPNDHNYCYNQLDRVGIDYVCPNQAQPGVFEMCESENQLYPGVYVENGQTMSYTQPPESLGPITTMPYSPSIPSSSNCVTFQSSDLFAALPQPTGVSSSASASITGSGSSGPAATGGASKGSGSAAAAASRTGSAGSVSETGSAGQTNGAGAVHTSAFVTFLGVAFSVVFFA